MNEKFKTLADELTSFVEGSKENILPKYIAIREQWWKELEQFDYSEIISDIKRGKLTKGKSELLCYFVATIGLDCAIKKRDVEQNAAKEKNL